ncbi:MAG: toxin, partial [Sphingomonadaceae bacterium]|nr:toxin [Sphingomonadaceae bacterium]
MARARTSDRPVSARAEVGRSGGDSLPRTNGASLTLPKGGGAIRGIGEKFSANPVTGTGSMTIPIATSPGRSDFGPKLALAYDSGAGNGPFGLGWALSLPAITRKTAQGLPRYRDAEESDDFILSDAEELVPILLADGTRHHDPAVAPGFTVRRYRPRIDTLYARIERWTRDSDGDTHWRSLSRDNILTIYGGDQESRIADPADPARIFSWLICETRDDRGNAILYRYKADDGTGLDLARPSERNRGPAGDPRRAVNRYVKRILYGNRQPLLTAAGARPHFLGALPAAQLSAVEWMFETVFDYGEHDPVSPTSAEQSPWPLRFDLFASHRAGFEVRTTRLCRRVLMVHHIPDIAGGDPGYDGVVRSTEFSYLHDAQPPDSGLPGYAMLVGITQAGWRRQTGGGYLRRSLPPVEFEYSLPRVETAVREVDPESAENLPAGVDGARYRWVDLHGEGIAGAFSEQGKAWHYKRNLSPLTPGAVTLAPLECVAARPNLSVEGGAQFLDLAGDGLPDLVMLRGTSSGFHEHDDAEGWTNFKAFEGQLAGDVRDPNARFIDLTGDGAADLLITEDDRLVWLEASGETGFGEARRVILPRSDDDGPRLVFADPEQAIHLADFSGDGLQDIVRIRNGEICYWPNLGYGRFGAKIAMNDAPHLDRGDQLAPNRVVLADIDGSGTTDLIYLHGEGVRLYFNLSGNGWSAAHELAVAPPVDNAAAVAVADLLGNGTASLVWSSPLPAAARRPIRFVSLMGDVKPHLLVRTVNNLGAETVVRYAPSTKFYLADRRDGAPWLTRLPFPVHVVEQAETHDRIARSRFVTRYAYHHGYFDGVEREFRGFAMVEQWDGEEFATASGVAPAANEHAPSFVPPVHTKSWFHTGAWLGRDARSAFFAGLLSTAHRDEYYREPGLSDAQARLLLLDDSILPAGLSIAEEREAARALKGALLRQEIYADDGTAKAPHPYTVTEQNLRVVMAQGSGVNRHAVFTTHANEAVSFHYERNPTDPRVQHVLTLDVDAFGNVHKQAAVNYPRRQPDASLPLAADRAKQAEFAILYAEYGFTNAIDSASDRLNPQPCQERSYELTGYGSTGPGGWFRPADFVTAGGSGPALLFDSEIDYGESPTTGRQRRLVEHGRTLFRRDDLSALLPLGQVEARALAGETYKLAYSAALIAQLFARNGTPLLADFASVLGGSGGYARSQTLKADGRFPAADADDLWWIPSGRGFLSPGANDSAAAELAYARQHFFLLLRARDPFHTNAASTESLVLYDAHDLLKVEARDAAGNRSTVGARLADGTRDPAQPGNDYRVLQPCCLSDANRNRTQVSFDALGLVVGAAIRGKPEDSLGDRLDGFVADLSDAEIAAHVADPLAAPGVILKRASTRMVYDLFAYHRTRAQPHPDPVAVHSMTREIHDADTEPGVTPPMQHSVSYSDGFGREIQRKLRVEPGPVSDGGPILSPRWVATGWVINNNKGKPVRQYEPLFCAGHGFEFGALAGVSPVIFYDPVGRVIATLHPNATYQKSVFDGWRQAVWDVNDTILLDPRTDSDVAAYTAAHFADPAQAGWQGWRARRQSGDLGPVEQDSAAKAAAHGGTPTLIHLDALGRPFLTIVDNGPDPAQPGAKLLFTSRGELDIEGNERAVRDSIVQAGDAEGRIVARYGYDMLGSRVRQESLDAGARWLLNDAGGHVLRTWDDRGQEFATDYDVLRRPLRTTVRGADPAAPAAAVVTDRFVYGDQHPQGEALNLRGSLYLHLDQAGSAATDARDFKGNVLRATRRLTAGARYRAAIDWTAAEAD